MNLNVTLISHEMLVVLLGLAVLLVDLWLPASSKPKLGYAAALGLGAILLYSFCSFQGPAGQAEYAFGKMYILDGQALFFKRFFLLAGLVVLVISVEFSDRFHAGVGEYYALLLFALTGMLFASSANDFSLMFVSLELITVTFYVLTSFQRGRVASLEAGVKYLIIGALSTAFTVFGIALVYGIGGKLNFEELREVAGQFQGNKIFLFGLLLILVGLGFKIAAFPFQIWAPDVYQGAPAPVGAYVATVSKGAMFALLLRYFWPVSLDTGSSLFLVFAAVAIASMLAGNLLALRQDNVKRILAYSSIANLGYLLVAFLATGEQAAVAVTFFLVAYFATTLVAFGVVAALSSPERDADSLADYRGLAHTRRWTAAAFTVALFSLAGMPLTMGFIGKFYVITAGAGAALWALVIVLVLTSTIGLYYYTRIVVAMWVRQPDENAEAVGTAIAGGPAAVLASRHLYL